MHVWFTGDLAGLEEGIRILAKRLSLTLSEDGIPFTVRRTDTPALAVSMNNGSGLIEYCERCQFFRALGLAAEQLQSGKTAFAIREQPQFTMNGPMFDVSQGNSAINVPSLKNTMEQLALMGLNTLMLYCEDSYEVKEQPYFSYMRPRYTEADMRELDDYADKLGIEMIPCIQTLAHLPDALRWNVFRDIRDYDACLLVGEEKTYAFIEDLIRAASRPFRTKKIHIGMDEAWKLGRGEYLTRNGYRPSAEIMREHLARVYAIVRKLGLEPMMWDDMFFRAASSGGYYLEDFTVPDEVKKMVPDRMKCIYWDYYKQSEEAYDKQLDMQLQLTDRIVFAGGTWSWVGFALNTRMTLNSTVPALRSCKKHGIREVFMTTWGDNGTECPISLTLFGCQLYGELGYLPYDAEFDMQAFARRFRFCTGGVAEDFMQLDRMDIIPETQDKADYSSYNTSKPLMWQDILTGLADKNYEGLAMNAHYAALAQDLSGAAARNPAFAREFEFAYRTADTLSVKSEMGIRLTNAYRAGDREALKRFAEEELPDLAARVKAMRLAHRRLWFAFYKPLGWDVMDLRYGGLLARVDSAIEEITLFLHGEMPRIEELEVERLPYNGVPGPICYMNTYGFIASPSRIAPNA